MTTELFDGYTLDGFHDEAFTAARGAGLHPRPCYEPLLARLEELTPAELAHRERA